MNKRGKSWHLIVTALLIVVFSFTALFGVSYTYGDTKNVYIKGAEDITIENLFDEHGVLNSEKFKTLVSVGDKVEVIPSHVCPTVNLYDTAYLVSNGKVIRTLPIACRGKSR